MFVAQNALNFCASVCTGGLSVLSGVPIGNNKKSVFIDRYKTHKWQ